MRNCRCSSRTVRRFGRIPKVKTITSKDNPVLKAAGKLHTRKGRAETGAVLVAGSKLIAEAVNAGFTVERVFINAGALERGEAAAGEYTNETALEEKLFRGLAGTVTPQPYLAVVKKPEHNGDGSPPMRILVLDRIGDPGNAGTMTRSALAAGLDGLWCLKGTADIFSDKALRASAGAVFHLPVREGLAAGECIDLAADLGLRLLVCSAGGDDLYETDLTGGYALVIGSEGAGTQEMFLEAADTVIGIPMAEKAESLNAAAAAAVVMYEALRQSRAER